MTLHNKGRVAKALQHARFLYKKTTGTARDSQKSFRYAKSRPSSERDWATGT